MGYFWILFRKLAFISDWKQILTSCGTQKKAQSFLQLQHRFHSSSYCGSFAISLNIKTHQICKSGQFWILAWLSYQRPTNLKQLVLKSCCFANLVLVRLQRPCLVTFHCSNVADFQYEVVRKLWEVKFHEIHLMVASSRRKEVKSPRFGVKVK